MDGKGERCAKERMLTLWLRVFVCVCVSRWQMLNERGGVESDLTILPLPGDEDDTAAAGGVAGSRDFYAVTSSATCTRDRDHIVPTDHTKPFLSSDRIAFSI